MAGFDEDFNRQLFLAIEEKSQWFDTTVLPKTQDAYRLHLTCVRNLFDALVKRSLITADPYKNDKKISDIVCPDSSEFNENERQIILGTRLSDYESMIDYVCNYMRFSVEQLPLEKTKKFLELNKTFAWDNLSQNSNKINTRTLANALTQLKNGAPPLTQSLIKDSTLKSANAIKEINETLKLLAEFQKEKYKAEIRKNIFMNPQFNKSKALNPGTLLAEIKRLYPNFMGKRNFNSDLVNELVNDETSPDRLEKQQKLLNSLKVESKKKDKKDEKIDTHEILMEIIRQVGTLGDHYHVIFEKIIYNHEILESDKNSIKDKLMRLFRKVFGLKEAPVEYEIIIIDKNTNAHRKERIDYQTYMENFMKRIKYYNSFAIRHSPGYNRIANQQDSNILEFLNRQISENHHLFSQLFALDEFFKNTVSSFNKSRIKGFKMELSTIKNIFIKIKQQKAEYSAFIEEQEQMKKLGIVDGN